MKTPLRKYEDYKDFVCTFDATANTLQKRKECLEQGIRDKVKASFLHEGKTLHQNEFDAIIQVCPFVKLSVNLSHFLTNRQLKKPLDHPFSGM